ncbi:hypothetical protein [Marinobacter litoralis]|uniref:hypothetical protein n=1 Tax=Marinobacter litoralis TaxID=187981 RepID=UPI0018EAF3BB|nr:hypothetical protein [Marinobacter litoralis]MBJ6137944.1 hypothetical protein [Marinobacter litoralis]
MKLKDMLTEYDDSLSGDSFIDPLGQLVIWSAYGQQVFRNRVNSVSNDVRNFTLNLLHHGVIRSILLDEEVQVSDALANELGPKDSLPFIHACLIHLENIFTYSMVHRPEDAGIDTLGILGGSKGRAVLEEQESKGDHQLIFTDKPSGQLLVRQLGLGVSGRYKTPFVEIGFFDQNYRYIDPTAQERWAEFEKLLSSSDSLRYCFTEVRRHLVNLVHSAQAKSQVPPRINFLEISPVLKNAYRTAFITGAKVGSETRDFWLSATGLNEGSAGELLNVMKKKLSQFKANDVAPEKLNPQSIVEEAVKTFDGETAERQKLQNIQRIEPLLAEVDLLFRVARHKKVQAVAEIRDHWQRLGRSETTLQSYAETIVDHPEIRVPLQETGRKRLEKILQIARLNTVEEQLVALLDYHATVMKQRGQLRWVELARSGEVHNHGRTASLPVAGDRPPGSWVNSYYLHQFNFLVSGYYGGDH